jgi:hypothetical protein
MAEVVIKVQNLVEMEHLALVVVLPVELALARHLATVAAVVVE